MLNDKNYDFFPILETFIYYMCNTRQKFLEDVLEEGLHILFGEDSHNRITASVGGQSYYMRLFTELFENVLRV